MAIDFTQLTAEDLETLAALVKGAGNRSPIWKPLKDLRPPTTAKGRLNRPHFEWQADEPPEGVVIKPYPRLFWDGKGVEHLVGTPEDEQRDKREDWKPYPPLLGAATDADRLQEELNSLSPEDREWVIKAEREARLNRLKDRMSGLSDADLKTMTPAAKSAKKSA